MGQGANGGSRHTPEPYPNYAFSGPFGLVCGPLQSPATASWIPDSIWRSACEAHDKCYTTCEVSKERCDWEFLKASGNMYYYFAVSMFADDAYDDGQKAGGCAGCNE